MGKCIYSHDDGAYCDKHDHGAVTVGCCGEGKCPDRKALTNADRIRAMTDEELAEKFEEIQLKTIKAYGNDDLLLKGELKKYWLDWLKKEEAWAIIPCSP